MGDGGAQQSRRLLPAQPSSVPIARRFIREWLVDAGQEDLVDTAELAVSEVVTNALMHAGTPVELTARMDNGFVRVEVVDGSSHLPRARDFEPSARIGRGLQLLEQSVDRWGAELRGDGKAVWFELGEGVDGAEAGSVASQLRPEHPDAVVIELLDVPLLLISAWLEHAGALLREHLLVQLDETDAVTALERHAAASQVLAVLEEQWPELELGLAPDELLASAVEPLVTASRLHLSLPPDVVSGFGVLDELLNDALALSAEGRLLTPPTQPEMQELRRWLTGEAAAQAEGAAPRPWPVPDPTDAAPPGQPVVWDTVVVDDAATARVAADDTDRIVAVSEPALELLGHDRETLVGRRLLAIIPPRFHQAHLAGFTQHLMNGRGPLLGVPVRVPVLTADGSERLVELTITAQLLPGGRSVFLASMRPV